MLSVTPSLSSLPLDFTVILFWISSGAVMTTLFSSETTYVTLRPEEVCISLTRLIFMLRVTFFELGLLSKLDEFPKLIPAMALQETDDNPITAVIKREVKILFIFTGVKNGFTMIRRK